MPRKPNHSLYSSFNDAIHGILRGLQTEANLRIHFAVTLVVLFMALFLSVSAVEFLILVVVITIVITAELFNTAIERLVDLVEPNVNPLAGRIKDTAAGAVLVSAIGATVVGFEVFVPRLEPIIVSVLNTVRQAPLNLVFVSLIVTCILVIIVKARSGRQDLLRGGWPSGHGALGGAALAAVVGLSGDPLVVILTGFIVFLLGQSRVDAGVHTWLEVFSGVALGFITGLILFRWFH
jgi:diacylglycerol kinase (ATP)